MTHGVTINGEYAVVYEKCAHCHLFIEDNSLCNDPADMAANGGCIADWVHVHRGDDADEAIENTHEAKPSGLIATNEVWQVFGPPAMLTRFLPVPFDYVHHAAPDFVGSLLLGGVPWEQIDKTLMGVV